MINQGETKASTKVGSRKTSSAILCLILRCTDAFTWFCAETSSDENLKFTDKICSEYLQVQSTKNANIFQNQCSKGKKKNLCLYINPQNE